MKRIIYSTLFASVATFGFSQVTLQSTDVNALVGESFDYERTDWISPGSGGASQTWDLSTMNSTVSSNLSYTAPNAGFPATTVTQVEQTGGELYIEQSTSGQFMHGLTANGVTMDYSNAMTLLEFPLSMSGSGSDTHTATFVSQGFNFTRQGTSTWEVDGWGTVITPNGTYTDVLRVKQTQIYQDTYVGGTIDYDVEIYIWLKAGIHYPVASVSSVTALGNTTEYGTYYSGVADLEEMDNVTFDIYPNPTTDVLNVSVDQGTIDAVTVTDLSGKIVAQENQVSSIDVSALNQGVYFVTVTLNDGRQTTAQKIMKH